jgi:YD repeat-containing protein
MVAGDPGCLQPGSTGGIGRKDYVNQYQYNALGWMTRVTQQEQPEENAVAEKRADFTYNALGQFDDILRYADLAGSDLVIDVDYGYDALSRLTSIEFTDAQTTVLDEFVWTFDELSRITSFTWGTTPDVSTYTYDATGQLIAADHDDQTDESYVYDLNGNRQLVDSDAASGQSYQTGRYNRILSDGTYTYEYDPEGNRTKRTNTSTGDYTQYEWDHRNRLVRVEERDDQDALLKAVDQVYDVFNRWIGNLVDEDGDTDVDTERYFVHDGNQIALQFDEADLTYRYLWGPAVDQLLADEQYDTGDTDHDNPATETGKVLWPIADHLNTPPPPRPVRPN